MAGAELLENAVKYGASGSESVRLSLRESAEAITLEVTNQLDAGCGDARALRERIEWTRGFDDAAKAYMAALAEVYAQPEREDHASGLGKGETPPQAAG